MTGWILRVALAGLKPCATGIGAPRLTKPRRRRGFSPVFPRLAPIALLLVAAASASPQELPRGPLTLANGHVTLAADASVSISTNRDDQGWFNYTAYEYNALRLVRLGFSAAVKANDRLALLVEVRSENADAPRASALYVRVRPWRSRPIDVQVGRIPPVFGAFSRRTYAVDNPLIGYPLAYQYLTSIRADAIPRTANDLVSMRSRGWEASYPLGVQAPAPGMPLVTAFRWDTGVEVHMGDGPIEASVAVTNGTLANPRVRDDNDGKQISARVVSKPLVGLIAGASFARGAFLAKALDPVLPGGSDANDFTQRAWGVDAEYSRGYWLVRGEAVFSRWRLPAIANPPVNIPLDARALGVEGRYKLMPGLFAAARYDRLTFNDITSARGVLPWEAPVWRVEAGGGYYLQPNAVVKFTYQHNRRDGGRTRRLKVAAAQLQVWF